jgi:hypothetical protein
LSWLHLDYNFIIAVKGQKQMNAVMLLWKISTFVTLVINSQVFSAGQLAMGS